jgi:ankyrin repeat protein
MNLPPPQDDDPIITQFEPVDNQWGLGKFKDIDFETGETILHNYCKYINTTPLAVYRYLIETLGCDINTQAKNKNTPIHCAFDSFKDGDITVLNYLINQKDVNINIKDEYGDTLLHKACNKINTLSIDIFKALIETHRADVNIQNNYNDTPLHHAIRYFNLNYGGDITILHYLLSQENVNVDIKGLFGSTLLHEAYDNINRLPIEIFKCLIETHGADVNAQDTEKSTPIYLALRWFNPNDGDITVLMYLLSQKGINVNFKGQNGGTLLHRACENINRLPIDVFKLLIEAQGCDINELDNYQNTPLHYAFFNFDSPDGGDITVLMYLLNQKGVNVNVKNRTDTTLLHKACYNINSLSVDIFKVLIETHGADVNAQNNDQDTPLHYALNNFNPDYGGDITVLTYVINQNNVDVNIKGKNGCNLLHLTCIDDLPSSSRFVELNAEFDTHLCQIVEIITERCVQQILDEETS